MPRIVTDAADLLVPMSAHVLWVVVLYAALTVVRAPSVWGLGADRPVANRLAAFESSIGANLSNQFEWPMMFYVVCLLLLLQPSLYSPMHVWLAWGFVAGRIVHSLVQIATNNIRFRGLVFMINFVAVLAMWVLLLN
ncbi:MAG: MAPEG family protein [Pseudomonadota bacterium]